MSNTGIPTIYRGRQYRSRLEARWAAFFDLLGWKYEYEPFDLRGWIPDFLILGSCPVLVEVKPVTVFPETTASEIERSGAELECLIVGCTIPVASYGQSVIEHNNVFGWLAERYPSRSEVEGDLSLYDFTWDDAVFGCWIDGKGSVGFCHSCSNFDDRISGGYDGGFYGALDFNSDEVFRLWNHAGNLTQWRGRQSVSR